MNIYKSLSTVFFFSIITLSLTGCASTKEIGYGTVIEQKKVSNVDYKPKNGTLVGTGFGAGAGATTGATIGAVTGATAGVVLSIGTFGLATPMIPALALAGAGSGAAIGGLAGGATGAGVGYATDLHKQGIGVYQFTIKPDNQAENINVTQYVKKPFPEHARVQITLKDDKYYIDSVTA